MCCKQFSFHSTLFILASTSKLSNIPKKTATQICDTSNRKFRMKNLFRRKMRHYRPIKMKVSLPQVCFIESTRFAYLSCHAASAFYVVLYFFLRARLVDEAKTRKFFFNIYCSRLTGLCGERNIIESANSVNWQSSERWRVIKKLSLKSLLKRLTGLKRFDDRSPERLLVFLQFLQFSHLFYTVVVLSGNHWQLDPLNSGQEKQRKN